MWKKDFLLHGTYLWKTLQIFICFWMALLHLLSYFFFCNRSYSSSLCTVFYSISSNVDEVLSINPSANVFFFLETLMPIIRTGLTVLVELIDLVNAVIIFLFQMTLLRWWTFLLGSQTVILIVLLFLIYFFLLMLVFVLQWLSLHWEFLIMLSQFPLTVQLIDNGMPHFIT